MKGLTVEALRKKLQAGDVEPVYQVMGPGEWARRQAVASLRTAAVGEVDAPWVVSQGRCGEVDLGSLLDGARTMPMGAPRRFVLLQGSENLKPQEVALLAEYVGSPSPFTCLVLEGARLPASGTGLKRLRAAGVQVECPALRPYQIPRWLESEIAARGHRAGRGVAERMQALLGDDPTELMAGLEKVLLYTNREKATLSAETVSTVLSPVPHGDVWAFIEALEDRHLGRSLAALEALLEQGEAPESILRLIARSRRQFMAGQTARHQGQSDDQVLEVMGVHPKARAAPRIRRSILNRLNRHRLPQLAADHERLLQADWELKGGVGGDPPAVLRRFLIADSELKGGGGKARMVLSRLLLDLLPAGGSRAGGAARLRGGRGGR